MSTYPGTIDSYTAVTGTTSVETSDHANKHNQVGSAVVALETVLGTVPATVTSVLSNFGSADKAERTSRITFGANTYTTGTTALAANDFLKYNGTNVVGGTVSNPGTLAFGSNQVVLGTAAPATDNILKYNGTNAVWGTSTSFSSPLTTKGDLMVHNGTSSIRQAVGLGGAFLRADSNQAAGIGWSDIFAPRVEGVSDSPAGTISPDMNQWMSSITLGTTAGNRTINMTYTPTGLTNDGREYVTRIKQNANNTGTVVWGANVRSSASGPSALGTESTWNYYFFRWNHGDTKWDFVDQSLSII